MSTAYPELQEDIEIQSFRKVTCCDYQQQGLDL